jgi:hypothetical protein
VPASDRFESQGLDWIGSRNAVLTERYVLVASRITAMVMGAIAVEMTTKGLEG